MRVPQEGQAWVPFVSLPLSPHPRLEFRWGSMYRVKGEMDLKRAWGGPASRSGEGKAWEAAERLTGMVQPSWLELTRERQAVRRTYGQEDTPSSLTLRAGGPPG